MRRFTQGKPGAVGLIAVAALACLGFFILVQPALGQTATPFSVESIDIGLGTADLRQTIINIIRVVLGLVTLTAVAYLVYGGFLWLTARGNDQQVEKAKRTILQATIGLVIIILAWAIVIFVARTIANSTSGPGGGGGPDDPPCSAFDPDCLAGLSEFTVTGITSCAQRPEYDENVPRSSNIAITFNARVDVASVQNAVEDPTTNSDPNLIIQRCDDSPLPPNPNDCVTWSTPHPINNQVFTNDTRPAGAAGATLAEWVANRNTITFYHKSFSTDETDLANNRWFQADMIYRVTIPRDEDPTDAVPSPTAILDTRDPARPVQYCRQDEFTPIEGGGCVETGNEIRWTMRTGTDTEGPPLTVRRTIPTSDPVNGYPDRNISRKPVIGVEFNNGIDPNSLDTTNFQVFELTADPRIGDPGLTNPNSWPTGPQVPPANLDFDYTSNGAMMALTGTNLLEPFTWYKVVVQDVRNLCGTLMDPNPAIWTFQTNDRVPGVRLMYPRSDNACPASEVFVQFATPMWQPNSSDCQVGALGSMVRSGSLSPGTGRAFGVVDQFDPADPNRSCMKYAWTPTTNLLTPSTNYTADVITDLVINQAGDTLHPVWSFHTGTPNSCFQEPYISRISGPGGLPRGQEGSCVSVIGNYFEKPLPNGGRESDGQTGADAVNLETTPQTAESWTNRTIVSTVDPGALATGLHQYQVAVEYPAPIGTLTSNEEDFTLDPGTDGDGVCLISVNPDHGPVGTVVDAKGRRFGNHGINSRFHYSLGNADWNVAAGDWHSDAINNITVTGNSVVGVGQVHVVRDDLRQSNRLEFEVEEPTTIGPNALIPRVVETTACNEAMNIFPSPNPRRGDTQACLNSVMSARFTIPIAAATITNANIYLEQCDPGCHVIGSNVVPASNREFALTPTSPLLSATQYRVTITQGVTSDAATPEPLRAPYSWTFTTTSGTTNCPIQSIGVISGVAIGTDVNSSPTSYLFRDEPFGVSMTAAAFGAQCRRITSPSNFSWSNSEPLVCTLTANSGDNVACFNTAPAAAEDTTNVRASAESRNSPNVAIEFDSTRCTTSSQCATNRFREACPGSICDSGRCTPVVNAIEPTSGPVGEWTTTKGCWFGAFNSNQSRLIFTDDKDGRAPDAAICDSPAATWTNERIIREVPWAITPEPSDDAITGPIRVRRFDGVTADGPTFTVNAGSPRCGLCRVSRPSGAVLTDITIKGARLGPDEPAQRTAQDQVNITLINSPTTTVMSLYGSWSDTSINTEIPATAEVGPSEIRASNQGGACSNSVPFVVLDPSASAAQCTTKLCAVDNDCAPEFPTANYGCARDFCCRPRPRLQLPNTNPAPGATDVCRNVSPQASFDLPLDSRTVTSDTVRYLDDARVANGSVRVNGGNVSYNPGLLRASSPQNFHFTTLVRTPVTLTNPSFELADANGVPTGWGATQNATQSTDRPAGHSGHSVFVDCSNCPPPNQAYIAQTLPAAAPIGTTYHVSGWVKVEQPAPVSSGLITQCFPGGSCGYDLIARAPGLYTGNSGGWKRADVQITKVSDAGARLTINCFANPGAKVWCDDITITQVTPGPTTIRSRDGVLANVASGPVTSPITFTTGTDICRAHAVVVQSSDGITRFTSQAETREYNSFVVARNGQRLNNILEYSWTWGPPGPGWRSGQNNIATVVGQAASASDAMGIADVTAVSNGATQATATAHITADASGGPVPTDVSGSAEVIVDLCDNPWDVTGQPARTGYADADFHFRLYYCRGQNNTTLLPNFGYTVSDTTATAPGRLKSLFFKESATSRDTIGLLLYANTEFLSPGDWYSQRFPLDTGGSSTVIAGYPAIRTGTTAYIGFTDLDGASFRGLILVIDYNSNNAEGETRTIFTRLLNTLSLNTNISDQVIRQQIVRDTKRRQDIRSVALQVENYRQANGTYPALSSGSFMVGLTTSAWPSWQQTLGNAVGRALPTDPNNNFSPACVPPAIPAGEGYEASSCWSEQERTFRCPAQSHIYLYRASGTGYQLFANMEYAFINASNVNPCDGTNNSVACSCFNYRYASTP